MESNELHSIKVCSSIAQINKTEWESIYPPIVEGYEFFKTIEETLTQQFKPLYITIRKNGALVCAAPCFIMDYPLETTIEGPLKKLLIGLKRLTPKLLNVRILLCGCQAAEGRLAIKNIQDQAIPQLLVKEMYSIAGKEKARLIAFKDFSQEYAPFFKPLLKSGFHKMQSYPSVELDLHFKSFEEYLGSLSRTTRKGLNKKFREAKGAKIQMEVRNDLGDSLEEAYKLYLNTLHDSEVQFERLSRDFFKNISENMPKETIYFLWHIQDKLVAFDLCLVSGGVLVDEYIGLDYDVAYKYHLYYVTFRDIVIWCIQNKIHRYESGALNYDPKKRLDFKFIPQYIYVKHKNKFLNLILGLACLFLKPENFDPVLKSMKRQNEKSKNSLGFKIMFLIIMSDVLESIAELFFKKGALATGMENIGIHNLLQFTLKIISVPSLWAGVLFYGLNFLVWIIVLSRIELSVAFPIGSTTYIIVPVLSMLFLHEKVDLLRWVGIALIIIGIWLISKSTQTHPER